MRRALIVVAALAATAVPAAAVDPLGTAGPLRAWSWENCSLGMEAQMQGACDPAPVPASLPPPERAEARMARALRLLALGSMSAMDRELETAIAENPHDLAALRLRVRLNLGEHIEEAEADIDRGLAIAPDDADLLADRAFLLRENPQRALPLADASLRARPQSADTLWIRALIYEIAGNLPAAEKDLDAAAALEPGETRLTMSRAELKVILGKYAEAEPDATTVILALGKPNAYRIRALARSRLGNVEGAFADLDEVLGRPGEPSPAAGPFFKEMLLHRAMLFVRLGRESEAGQDLDALLTMGGQRMILQVQLLLRRQHVRVPLTGVRSPELDKALRACFIDNACGKAITDPA